MAFLLIRVFRPQCFLRSLINAHQRVSDADIVEGDKKNDDLKKRGASERDREKQQCIDEGAPPNVSTTWKNIDEDGGKRFKSAR